MSLILPANTTPEQADEILALLRQQTALLQRIADAQEQAISRIGQEVQIQLDSIADHEDTSLP